MEKIKRVLQWAWDNRTDLMGVVAAGSGFGALAGGLITKLLSKTPNGDPSEVTDEMVQDLIDNWPGAFKSSAELGFEPKPEDDPTLPIEPDED